MWYSNVPQPIRFLLVGGANTLLGGCLIWLNMTVLGLSPLFANALAYTMMLPLSLWAFARGVFEYFEGLIRPALMFFCVFVTAVLANLAVVTGCLHFFAANLLVAQVAGMTAYVCVYYLLNRALFCFLNRPNTL